MRRDEKGREGDSRGGKVPEGVRKVSIFPHALTKLQRFLPAPDLLHNILYRVE